MHFKLIPYFSSTWTSQTITCPAPEQIWGTLCFIWTGPYSIKGLHLKLCILILLVKLFLWHFWPCRNVPYVLIIIWSKNCAPCSTQSIPKQPMLEGQKTPKITLKIKFLWRCIHSTSSNIQPWVKSAYRQLIYTFSELFHHFWNSHAIFDPI